ncbi:hypothetical protein CCR75_002104 [Bremia lactucae]|uniref:Transglutaminase elicitor n=1 Tax=Bremia lactucae TaxID=4779 RepID=A0A976FNX3_BRELC|nr:hypothetical protein CCR75_006262 [Bremia lactucae]TDH69905.1 hypothetical protein CCR75_002104 [Bremia lactucae]
MPVALALVGLHRYQISATSLDYDPVTIANTTDMISSKFPARGGLFAESDCAITVQSNPTLLDLTMISTVAVMYTELLANSSRAPIEALSTLIGKAILTESTPLNANQDVYTTMSVNATKSQCVMDSEAPNKVNTPGTNRSLGEKLGPHRKLEAKTHNDIAKLETHFGVTMERVLAKLPTTGSRSPIPWPGPYWPTSEDSINVKYNRGQPSAAEKYAKAFGLDVNAFMNKVSQTNGIDSMSHRRRCVSDRDCSSLKDNSSCAIRTGKRSGYCIPTWYGICHAWAPAAMLEPEPQCAVTHRGVIFQPTDLKALLTNVYDDALIATVFTGTRFNGGPDSIDTYGRHVNGAHRDLNPAFFHIVVANLLGTLNTTFIVDVTAGVEVWNQPVRGFKVYETTALSLQEAAQTFYGLKRYPWNVAARSIVYMKTRLSWVYETYTDGGLVQSGQVDEYTTGAYYTYLLELDARGIIIGGEWVYESENNHPDFIWFPKAKPPRNTVTSIGLSYAHVTMLLRKSVACVGAKNGTSSSNVR